MHNNKLIGRGKTAEVYELGPDKVLKLFYEYTGEGLSDYELSVGQIVFDAGVPSPAVYGKTHEMGRNGFILERASGNSMFREIELRPWKIGYYAKELARFHAAMHSCTSNQLISQYNVIKNKIGVSEKTLGDDMKRIFCYLDALPDGSKVCHGDLHPKNLFKTQRGYIAIDWADVYCGNPASDVARTALILASPHIPAYSGPLIRLIMAQLKKSMLRNYLTEYTRLTGMSFDEINCWLLPVAAGRLKEAISGEEQWLMDIINGRSDFKFKRQKNGTDK